MSRKPSNVTEPEESTAKPTGTAPQTPQPLQTHITLAEGKPEKEISTTLHGQPAGFYLLEGLRHPIVPDDSRDPGIGASLAARLVQAGWAEYCGPTPEAEEGATDAGSGTVSDADPAVPVVPVNPDPLPASE